MSQTCAVTTLARGAAVAVILVACGSSESTPTRGERFVNNDQGYSLDQPAGWRHANVRGAVQFARAPSAKDAKMRNHTIVVRAADKPRQLIEGKPTEPADLVAATETVLRAMPRARLEDREEIDGAELPGVRFSLTFVPTGQTATYRREHALLVGKKLFHVIYTAPANEQIDEAAFKGIVTTLKEGV